ncbi:YfhO family protein [Levilactobacillus mulengensis]|uniref:YfhO family protein n=1 Tax=Levilactobacillus mulengensis TaxID=2486025 RepID=UPI000F77F862|nr:YfhO family protein [Levilactobacillus mulengensis]
MKRSRENYLYYSGIFIILAGLLYGIFILTGKSFIWEGDGLAQHYPVLEKFYTWLHQGSLTGWSWDLGLGADKVTTFSYYVLGDPFSYLIGLFPRHALEFGYNCLILLRLYASGLAFLFFARQRDFRPTSALLGTLAYTFTGYSLYVSIRHPFFLLPMILFPLLAYGIDHVLRGRSWVPLAVFTGLALVSNFYFAYILAIGSLVYAVLRYLSLRPLPLWRTVRRLVGAGVTGFLLAGSLFIPSVLGALGSTRAGGQFANGYKLFPFDYYLRLPNALVTTGNPMRFWVSLGVSGLVFLGIVYVFRHFRQYLWLNVGLLLLAAGLLIPAVPALMNGGTTPSQRWLLLGNLAFGLATMHLLDHVTALTRGDLQVMIASVLGLLVVVWAANGFIFNNHVHDFTMYGLLLVTLGALICGVMFHWSSGQLLGSLLALLSLNIVTNGYGYYSPNSGGASQQLLTRGVATKFQKNFYDGAQRFTNRQSGFSRSATSKYYYYSDDAKTNLGMNLGSHDIMSYFSVQNGAVGDFSQALGNAQFQMNKPINQADSRTTLNNLLGVRTIFARGNQLGMQALPYGYQPATQHGQRVTYRDQPVHGLGNAYDTTVLQSKNALPLAYVQLKQLRSGQFNRLNGSDREQALTTGALVAGGAKGVPTTTYHSHQREVKYTTTSDSQLALTSLAKVVRYRQQNNQLDPAPDQIQKPSLRKHNLDRSVSIETDRPRLRRLTRENRQILRANQKKNAHGLRQLTSDNQNQPIAVDLTVKRPKITRGTEVYLELRGIQAQGFGVIDNYRGTQKTQAFRNSAFTGIARLNRLRNALWNLNDGAYTLTVGSKQNVTSYRQLGQSNLSDYQPQRRVLLNLGYTKQPRQTIRVTFQGVKQLTFKSAKLIAVPFGKTYDQRMQALKHQGLHQLRVHENTVTGTSQAQQAGVLTTSIPYSTGWHLTVDGKATPTTKVNVGFVGARLPAGTHRIRLTYRTPGLRVGRWLTGLGLVVLVVGGTVDKFRRQE